MHNLVFFRMLVCGDAPLVQLVERMVDKVSYLTVGFPTQLEWDGVRVRQTCMRTAAHLDRHLDDYSPLNEHGLFPVQVEAPPFCYYDWRSHRLLDFVLTPPQPDAYLVQGAWFDSDPIRASGQARRLHDQGAEVQVIVPEPCVSFADANRVAIQVDRQRNVFGSPILLSHLVASYLYYASGQITRTTPRCPGLVYRVGTWEFARDHGAGIHDALARQPPSPGKLFFYDVPETRRISGTPQLFRFNLNWLQDRLVDIPF